MKLAIDPNTTVGALLEAYPEAEDVLVELAPAFRKLRNPLIRRTVAKVATLEQAAKIGGVSLQAMILRLRAFSGGEKDSEGPLAPVAAQNRQEAATVPDWVAEGHVVEEVDGGAMLDRGVHPLGRIRQAVSVLGSGELVLLRSPFRPEPLIEAMQRAGARVYCVRDGPGHVTYCGRPPA